jgi:hypothetical protein
MAKNDLDFEAKLSAEVTVKRKTKLMVAIVLVVALFLWLRHELKIDRCLDQGGRWNKAQSVCEFQ